MGLFSEKAKYQIRANELLWRKILKKQKRGRKKENYEAQHISLGRGQFLRRSYNNNFELAFSSQT